MFTIPNQIVLEYNLKPSKINVDIIKVVNLFKKSNPDKTENSIAEDIVKKIDIENVVDSIVRKVLKRPKGIKKCQQIIGSKKKRGKHKGNPWSDKSLIVEG